MRAVARPGAERQDTTPTALSPACTAALQTIKTAFADDRAEDAAEKVAAKTGADPAAIYKRTRPRERI